MFLAEDLYRVERREAISGRPVAQRMLSHWALAERHYVSQYRLSLGGGQLIQVEQERLGEDSLRLIVR